MVFLQINEYLVNYTQIAYVDTTAYKESKTLRVYVSTLGKELTVSGKDAEALLKILTALTN